MKFVFLLHEMPKGSEKPTHVDFMLETQWGLRTWSMPEIPVDNQAVPAEELAIHRRDYLDYEGDVSGNRGRVSRLDRGEYTIRGESSDEILVRVSGERYQGNVRLERVADSSWKLTMELC